MTIAIFTEPEVTNCFSIIALVIIRESKTKLAGYVKNSYVIICICLRDHSKLTMVGRL